MKRIIHIAIIAITIAMVDSCGKSNASKVEPIKSHREQKDADLKQFLREAGFEKVPELVSFDIDKEKKWWWDSYGVYFVSFAEMDSLIAANNFIIGESSRYKENIPEYALTQMKNNYYKIKDELIQYGFRNCGSPYELTPRRWLSRNEVGKRIKNGRVGYYISFGYDDLTEIVNDRGRSVLSNVYQVDKMPKYEVEDAPELTKVLVVADKSKFDITGMQIINNKLVKPHPDPIAVIHHRKGYVILAKWL